MTTGATVDVVIPTFNRAHLLGDAIGSALTQTHPVRTVIVVDDGSTDDTLAVLGEITATEDRVRVIHQSNAGPSAARNRGAEQSDAEFIAFADSDDLMVEDRIEWQLAYLAAEPDCPIVLGTEELWISDGVTPPPTITPLLTHGLPLYSYPSMFMRKRLFDALGGYDEAIRIGEDLDLYIRAAQEGIRADFVDRAATTRRIFGDNLTYENVGTDATLLRLLHRNLNRRRTAPTGAGAPTHRSKGET
ncbi:MAG: glycosyltransferase family A protein [Acidimicrobiales bacterium]